MHHKRNQLLSSDAVGACGVLRVGEEVKILVSFKLKKWYDSIGEIRNGECFMSKGSLKLGGAVFWAAVYFCMMVFYTALDITVWRTAFPAFSEWVNMMFMILCVGGFVVLLKRTGYEIRLFANVTFTGILMAAGCSLLFFLLLDNCLDPVFERIFPQSEEAYQETIQRLLKSPVTSFLQVCVMAPFIEEILMRGFVLGGLKSTYGAGTALLVSAFLFALLHFNMVQTLSAFVCGAVLGMLYLKTDSIFCCILAHCGYNLISCIAMLSA